MDYMRMVYQRAGGETPSGGVFNFVASTPGTARDGIDLAPLPWVVDNYRKNPVVTWCHDFSGARLPIGRGTPSFDGADNARSVGGETMLAGIVFDEEHDAFAADIAGKYRRGILHAISVSWDDVDEDGIPVRVSGKKAVAHELLEIAAVPVPGDPRALHITQRSALASLGRQLIEASEDVSVADDNVTPPAEATADAGDDSADADAEAQGRAWPNVATEMVAVFAPDCPDDDRTRRRRYNTLTARYRTLGRTPPEFLSAAEVDALGPDEWRGLWLEDELSGSRVGAVLNARNTELLVGARDALDTVIKSAQATGDDKGRTAGGASRRELDPDLAAVLERITATLDKIAAAVEVDATEDDAEDAADAAPEGDPMMASADAGDERTTDDDDGERAALLAAVRAKLKG